MSLLAQSLFIFSGLVLAKQAAEKLDTASGEDLCFLHLL